MKATVQYLQQEIVTHQNVVRFDVSMQNVAAFEEFEGQEKLLAVRAHSLDVKPNVLAILPQHLPQVHAKARKQESCFNKRTQAALIDSHA